jgi:hypothetical protein
LYQSYVAGRARDLAAGACAIVGWMATSMTRDHRKLVEFEAALTQLRDDLNALSSKISAEPRNTSLVIRRVNLMGRIMTAQTTVDQLRQGLAQV